uniref:ORF-136 protein n=1 Tax=Lymantria dispar multicapsid nuclear polyhedrosis virus TaxID=10449 RepID=V9THH4_NPVLD|nr:ORF-136 protein [Lymantria dispar multiple nucleopolyhedrovirus]QDH05975.1 ORF130 [Lymantria dispar multiple nucleopolyhedrovirus]QPD01930.1 hypothetical protein [Lymantria dispar multiple nucleopolyhedrovirus]QPD02104.1 hypothetical protein [Lymantria dispar multiple nucleopolyhedrovirus]
MECYICFETALRTVVPDCGHAVCDECYSKLVRCPVCRRRFPPPPPARRPAPESPRRPAPESPRRRPELGMRDDFKSFFVSLCISIFD